MIPWLTSILGKMGGGAGGGLLGGGGGAGAAGGGGGGAIAGLLGGGGEEAKPAGGGNIAMDMLGGLMGVNFGGNRRLQQQEQYLAAENNRRAWEHQQRVDQSRRDAAMYPLQNMIQRAQMQDQVLEMLGGDEQRAGGFMEQHGISPLRVPEAYVALGTAQQVPADLEGGSSQMLRLPKARKLIQVGPGEEVGYDDGGKWVPLAKNPRPVQPKNEDYTLGPGGVRYGADGQEKSRSPFKPNDTMGGLIGALLGGGTGPVAAPATGSPAPSDGGRDAAKWRAPKVYDSEQAASDAEARGELRKGDRIIIAGRSGTWQ